MKRLMYPIIYVFLFLFTACNVHEWPLEEEIPEEPEKLFPIRLDFVTEMEEIKYFYKSRTTDNIENYCMRLTFKAFPYEDETRNISRNSIWDYVMTYEVGMYDYDCELKLSLPEGQYNLMVWADFVKKDVASHLFYNPDNFAEITLYGNHKANTDLRDAFSGNIVVDTDSLSSGMVIEMKRPLAKFTFISTDLEKFIDKEEETAYQRAQARGEEYTRGINLDDYKLTFSYVGFMPCAYNMFTDKPNDSKTGVSFESSITVNNESEATMGFDYLLINGEESTASIVLTLCDKEGKELFTSNPIEFPVKRNCHTLVCGEFLTLETSGGVGIVPDFEDEYNYEVKY